MGKDVIYTNGVIAYREKFLLKDKLLKLCEGTAEDAFKSLNESGYGNGAEAASLYDYELLTARALWTISSANTRLRGRRKPIFSRPAIFITQKRF